MYVQGMPSVNQVKNQLRNTLAKKRANVRNAANKIYGKGSSPMKSLYLSSAGYFITNSNEARRLKRWG
jgi:hypothetical protein